jgi:hypothetical protein
MRGWLPAIVGALWVIGTLHTAHSQVEARVALVIGNGGYHSFPNLRNPVNDVQALDLALSAVGFHVIRLENVTKEQMVAGLLELTGQLNPGAISLIYYAGYGINMGGRDYLLPVNTKLTTPASLSREAVDVDEIVSQIGRTHASKNIIILDASRANPLASPYESTMDMSKRGNGTMVDPAFRSISGGLAPVNAPAGILIAFPTTPGKIVPDNGGALGLYATELIRAIAIPGASIETVFKETRLGVVAQSGGTQVPWESSSLTTSFSFWPNANAVSSSSNGIPSWVPRPTGVVPNLPPPDTITARVQQVAQQEGVASPPSLVFDEATTPAEYRSLLGPWGPAVWKSGTQNKVIQNKVILILLGINALGSGHVFYCSSTVPAFKGKCEFDVARVVNGRIMYAHTWKKENDNTLILHEYELGDDGNLHGVRAGRDTIVLPPLR